MNTAATKPIEGVRVFRADQRGVTRLAWLDGKHSFSFGEHHDPDRMGYGVLRVLNDDVIAPGGGFGMHPHRDMEIISLVLEGALEHRDSRGNREVLNRGDVQTMTAGSGIRHSEVNASDTDPIHLLQIWILPDAKGHEPGHATLRADPSSRNRWREIAAGDPRDGGLPIHQDAAVSVGYLDRGIALTASVPGGRLGYLHVGEGRVKAGGLTLSAGDALELAPGTSISIDAGEDSTLVFFDLPGE